MAQVGWRNLSRFAHDTLELNLPSNPNYGIAAPETIQIVVPASAVLSRRAREAAPL